MADQYDDDEDELNNEEIQRIATKAIQESVVQDAIYERSKVNTWTQHILDKVIKELAALPKKFKYVVTCMIQQDVGAGLTSASCTHWEGGSDGFITVEYKCPTFTVHVSVFAPHI